jgi:hypothetical protein
MKGAPGTRAGREVDRNSLWNPIETSSDLDVVSHGFRELLIMIIALGNGRFELTSML